MSCICPCDNNKFPCPGGCAPLRSSMGLDKCGVVTAAAILRLGGSVLDEDCGCQPLTGRENGTSRLAQAGPSSIYIGRYVSIFRTLCATRSSVCLPARSGLSPPANAMRSVSASPRLAKTGQYGTGRNKIQSPHLGVSESNRSSLSGTVVDVEVCDRLVIRRLPSNLSCQTPMVFWMSAGRVVTTLCKPIKYCIDSQGPPTTFIPVAPVCTWLATRQAQSWRTTPSSWTCLDSQNSLIHTTFSRPRAPGVSLVFAVLDHRTAAS